MRVCFVSVSVLDDFLLSKYFWLEEEYRMAGIFAGKAIYQQKAFGRNKFGACCESMPFDESRARY